MCSAPYKGLGLEDNFDDFELLVITNDRCHFVTVICQHGRVITQQRLVCKAKPNHKLQELEGISGMPGVPNIDNLQV